MDRGTWQATIPGVAKIQIQPTNETPMQVHEIAA